VWGKTEIMKKFFLITLFSCFTLFGISQSVDVSGIVLDDEVPVAGADVYIMTIGNVVEPGDTLGSTVTDESGNFNITVQVESDSLMLTASASTCPNDLFGFMVGPGIQSYVEIACGSGLPGDSIYEYLYIGGVPVNDSGDEWYFISSTFGNAVSYNWSIDGNNFTTTDVTYTFPEPGTYTVSLSVEMASGNILTDELEVNVVDIPNCQALFFPFVDSLNMEELVFVNASIGSDLSYFWDFGDGNTSTEAYPTHQFEDSASYDVCLTITSDDCEDTFCLTLSPVTIGGWNGLQAEGGRLPGEAKDGNGFEFTVVPPGGAPLSTQEFEFDVELTTYPNPTDGNAFVNFYAEKSGSAQIRVLSMTGKLVMQENINIASGENQIELTFSQLSEGVYIVFFESASNQRGVTKVVIR